MALFGLDYDGGTLPMVKQQRMPVLATVFLVSSALLASGCGLKKWWGEESVKPGVIEMASGAECPPAIQIVKGTAEESRAAFECLSTQLNDLWTQVVGKQKNVLNDQEISILVRKGLLKIGPNVDRSLHNVFGVKELLGIKSSLSKETVDRWISLVRLHRESIRALYLKYTATKNPIMYSDLKTVAKVASEFLREMNWSMDSDELGEVIFAVFEIKDRDFRSALVPAAQVAINFLNAVCPNFSARDTWNTREIGACLVALTDHFEAGAPWFEFTMNPVENVSFESVEKIKESMRLLGERFETWFRNPALAPVSIAGLIQLSRRMGVNPPNDLIEKMDLVTRFNKDSNGKFIHPSSFSGIFRIMRQYHTYLLDGLPVFVEAVHHKNCLNPEAQSWGTCRLDVTPDLFGRSRAIKLAMKVKNPNFGTRVTPFDGGRFARLMFFHTLSGRIIDAFGKTHSEEAEREAAEYSVEDLGATRPDDTPDGVGPPVPVPLQRPNVISADLNSGSDDMMDLIRSGLQAYEVIHSFVVNILRKMNGLPFEEETTIREMQRSFNLKGLAKLITMTNDVLVLRTKEDRKDFESAVKGLLANITNIMPTSSLFLDQMAVTAVITLMDSLSDYRNAYLEFLTGKQISIFDRKGVEQYLISRDDFVAALPRMVARHFPRTFESRRKFGFERSCGIALDGVLPDSQRNPGMINVSDLDVMTIILSAMEGLLDGCDVDNDLVLSWKLIKGDDELDCGYSRAKDFVQRLIQSGIVVTSSTDRRLIDFALNFVNSTTITRPIGKVMMSSGTMRHVVWHLIQYGKYRDASIGTMYGVFAEAVDMDRVKVAVKAQKEARKRGER